MSPADEQYAGMLPTEAQLEQVIPAFYARVRQDPLIGPLFNRWKRWKRSLRQRSA